MSVTGSGMRVLVADGAPVLIEAVRSALESSGCAVCAMASSAVEAVARARAEQPDVCLVDSDLLADLDAGIEDLARAAPSSVIVLFAGEFGPPLLAQALHAGAAGVLSKDVQPERLAEVLVSARAGEPIVPRHQVAHLLAYLRRDCPPAGREPTEVQRYASLTGREVDVIALLAQGRSTGDIAHELSVAPVTVRTHISAIVRKLKVHDRGDLVKAFQTAP